MKDEQNDSDERERRRQRQRERRQAYKTGDRQPKRVLAMITQAHENGDSRALLRAIKNKTRWQDSCWIWTGWIASNGKPALNLGPHQMQARRVVAEACIPSFDKTSQVFVTCGQKLCLNPEHLSVRHIKT